MTGQPTRQRLLAALARLDRRKVFLGVLVVAVLALFTPGALGGVLVFAVVVALATLLATTWPVTPRSVRALRLAVLAILVILAVDKLT